MKIESTVLKILQQTRPEVDFSGSHNFLGERLLDSFDIVSIVSDLDSEFGISIDGTQILPENFSSLEAIAELIRRHGVSE
jgi:acyl carrier protein